MTITSEALRMPEVFYRLNWNDPAQRDQVFYLQMLKEILDDTISTDQLRWVALNRLYAKAKANCAPSAAHYDAALRALSQRMRDGEGDPGIPVPRPILPIPGDVSRYRRVYFDLLKHVAHDAASRDQLKLAALNCLLDDAKAGGERELSAYYENKILIISRPRHA